jgi:hypothetical protein
MSIKFKEFLECEDSLLAERDENFKKQPRWKFKKKELTKPSEDELASRYDNKPMKVTRPVIMANGKTIAKEFTIDNNMNVRRALSGVTLRDMGQVEANPDKRSHKPSYVIDTGSRTTKTASIPHRLHGLPHKTARKAGYEPEDLRREVYAA